MKWNLPIEADIFQRQLMNLKHERRITGLAANKVTGTFGASAIWNGAAIGDTYIASAAAWSAKVSSPGSGVGKLGGCW